MSHKECISKLCLPQLILTTLPSHVQCEWAGYKVQIKWLNASQRNSTSNAPFSYSKDHTEPPPLPLCVLKSQWVIWWVYKNYKLPNNILSISFNPPVYCMVLHEEGVPANDPVKSPLGSADANSYLPGIE